MAKTILTKRVNWVPAAGAPGRAITPVPSVTANMRMIIPRGAEEPRRDAADVEPEEGDEEQPSGAAGDGAREERGIS